MSTEPSVVHLILGASLPVQIVLLLLLAASMASWALIFHKSSMLRAARKRAKQFEEGFWSGGSLNDLYDRITRDTRPREGQEAIFESGFREFKRLRQVEGRSAVELIEGVERAMRVTLHRQIERFEEGLPILATIGSVSPYIGLFGTVWGIMSAFMNLGNAQNATLATVAPPIAEALIATAMGLFAAIPAVVAYNRYSTQVDELYGRYDRFTDEFLGLLQRQIGGQ